MNTAVLPNGTCYYIPQTDSSFFRELAERMNWQAVDASKKGKPRSEFERAMALMDTMMVHGGAPVPADADGMDIKIEQKYSTK